MQYPLYDKYQPSKFEKNLNIPIDWQEKRLKFIASHNDETLSEKTDPDYEIEYVDISSVNLVNGIMQTEVLSFDKAPSRARRVVKDGDCIVSTVRTYLKAIATIRNPPENMVVSTGFAVIRPKEEICKNYLSYFLQSQGFVESVVAHSVGVSYPAINASDLVCLPVCFPVSVIDQNKIADFLDYKTQQIDQLIEKKTALIKKLNEQRIAFITQAVTKGLDKNAKMKPSGVDWLGDVPEHWEVKKLKFIGEAIIGLTYSPSDVCDVNNGTLVLRSSNIQDGLMVDNDNTYVSTGIPDKLITKENDIVICSRNGSKELIGKNAKVTGDYVGVTFGAFTTVFRSQINDFLYYIFNSSLFKFQSGRYLTSTINQLTIGAINSFEVPIPPGGERQNIEEYLAKKLDKNERARIQNYELIARLNEYRSALITSAVTGKIDVQAFEVGEGKK